MSRAVITWIGGTKTIEGATVGDPRVDEELERLSAVKARNVSITFEDEFDIGRYIDDEEEYD